MRYQMDSQNAGELESSAYVALDRDPVSNPAIFLDCSVEPSRTRQEFAEDCDINNIMAKYETTGFLPQNVNTREPAYLDLSNTPTRLQDALALVEEAQTAFMTLPAEIRRDLDNSPINFVEWAQDPANADTLRKYGLAKPLPVEAPPMKVEVINPVQDAAKAS